MKEKFNLNFKYFKQINRLVIIIHLPHVIHIYSYIMICKYMYNLDYIY